MGGRQAPSGQTKNQVRAHNSQRAAFADPVCVGHTDIAPRPTTVARPGAKKTLRALSGPGIISSGKLCVRLGDTCREKLLSLLACQVSLLRFVSLWLALHQQEEMFAVWSAPASVVPRLCGHARL